ncbi:MAG: hypothetical protein HQL69_20235 [Magnetococcales bacterium]|nr:hypothetical protein [Magnetococcales bacterium]
MEDKQEIQKACPEKEARIQSGVHLPPNISATEKTNLGIKNSAVRNDTVTADASSHLKQVIVMAFIWSRALSMLLYKRVANIYFPLVNV